MTKTLTIQGAAALLAVALLGANTSQAQQDPGQDVRDKVDKAVKSIKQGTREITDAARAEFRKVRDRVQEMSTQSRVFSRIHWDQTLNKCAIEVDVQSDGVVFLRGSVADETAKNKAVKLAAETVGVSRVVDELSVAPNSSTTTTSTSREPKKP
jgi:hyperosmotically inducible periplasmic protein